MAESASHMEYVTTIRRQVRSMLPECEYLHVFVDSPYEKETPPHVINNFRPDLYYCHNDHLIIGEAKTDDDFNRPHSIEQYLSYLQECHSFQGDSLLILSGSWRISASFANLMRNMQAQNNLHVRVMILNEMGVYKDMK